MATTIEATFDGQVFRPSEAILLPPNTTVRLTVETISTGDVTDKPASFLRTARSLNLEGPPDWASNLDDYLHGGESSGAG